MMTSGCGNLGPQSLEPREASAFKLAPFGGGDSTGGWNWVWGGWAQAAGSEEKEMYLSYGQIGVKPW
jgi:hypothetical protein